MENSENNNSVLPYSLNSSSWMNVVSKIDAAKFQSIWASTKEIDLFGDKSEKYWILFVGKDRELDWDFENSTVADTSVVLSNTLHEQFQLTSEKLDFLICSEAIAKGLEFEHHHEVFCKLQVAECTQAVDFF